MPRHRIPGEVAEPHRHRRERQHDKGKERRIGKARITGLQHLPVPQAGRRLRVGFDAGREFDKARVISGGGDGDEEPDAIRSDTTNNATLTAAMIQLAQRDSVSNGTESAWFRSPAHSREIKKHCYLAGIRQSIAKDCAPMHGTFGRHDREDNAGMRLLTAATGMTVKGTKVDCTGHPLISTGIRGRGFVFSQRARAATVGSIPDLFHHAGSSPQRWTSRWCPRQRGTMNSSLTLQPSATAA
jgi:hypothetical protein